MCPREAPPFPVSGTRSPGPGSSTKNEPHDCDDVGEHVTASREHLGGTALCWGCAPDAGLIELAEAASRHGFPEISVRPSQYLRARRDPTWRERLEATGVTVGVVDALLGYLPGSPPPDRVDPARELDGCLEAADELGARTLNVAHYRGDPVVDVDRMAESVRTLAAEVGRTGLRISLEFIPGTGLPDLATTLQVIEAADSPGTGVMFDTWHHLRAGGTSGEIALTPPGSIIEAQISGRRTPDPAEVYVPMAGRLPPGQGDAPVAPMIAALRGVAPDVVLGVEVFASENRDPDATVSRLARATSRFLASADTPFA